MLKRKEVLTLAYYKDKDVLHIIDLVMSDNSIKHKGKAIRKRLKELPSVDIAENLRLQNKVEMLEIEVNMLKEAKDRSTESAMRVIKKQDAEIKLLTEALHKSKRLLEEANLEIKESYIAREMEGEEEC